MPELFQVTWCGDQVKDIPTPHGTLKSYRIALMDRQGIKVTNDEGKTTFALTQKPETRVPEIGDKLYGHIEEGWKFKKDQRPDDAPQDFPPTLETSSAPSEEQPRVAGATSAEGEGAVSAQQGANARQDASGGQTSSQAPARSSSERTYDVQRMIVRQHSQTAAIAWMKLRLDADEIPGEDVNLTKLRERIDWFDHDVLGGDDS